MPKKISSSLSIALVIVVVVAGVFLWRKGESKAPLISGEGEAAVIAFTDVGYSPPVLTIKKGTVVTFKNESSQPIWPASAFHPTHTVYPTTGGCLGSTFDACREIAPGASWSFQFDIPGNWKYHDHLLPRFNGTVAVEE